MGTWKHETAAQTAKKIRRALKAAFPGTTFSVRSRSYSGGSSVDVGWTDGPRVQAVDEVLKRYQSASFDGMIDLKSVPGYVDPDDGLTYCGADWVSSQREISPAYAATLKAYSDKNLRAPEWQDFRIQQWAEEHMLAELAA